jgi:PleD family two-component response regulator
MVKKQILIVDSNKTILEKLQANFIRDGFDANSATGEEEAKAFIATKHPDLIISEILLDDCDGIQFCKDIKDNPDLADIPLIVLTSANDHIVEIKCLRNGVDEFFVKRNITRQELMLKVQILIERYSMYNFLRRTNCYSLQGDLTTRRLKNLIKMLQVAKLTGRLHLANDYHEGEIVFMEGQIINSVLDTAEGIDAIFKLDKLKGCYFGFEEVPISSYNDTIDQNTETIISLLEG